MTNLVPVSPSRVRIEQPVYLYSYDERLRLLDGAHKVEASVVKGQKILLFDDLYRSGATMNAITAALYDEGAVADVFALVLTRTRSRS